MQQPLSPRSPAPTAVGRDSLATEDADVLRAVMAFLDDDEDLFGLEATPPTSEGGSHSGSGGSDVESVAESTVSSLASTRAKRSTASARKAQTASGTSAPRVFNRSRVRRRHEVISLREQVIALEERLEVLQNGDTAPAAPAEDEELKKLRVGAWQGVAECQREQLTEAEAEREKLRALIKDYKLTVRRVERFLQKQTFPMSLVEDDFARPRPAIADDAGDGFEEISRNLPAMYLQINGVFSDARFNTQVEGVRDIRVQNEESAHMSIEVLQSRLLPFSIEKAAKAVWHFHQVKATKVVTTAEEQVEESENFMRRTAIAVLDIPNHKGRARARMETRRFVEHDRVVILQHAVIDQTERISGNGPEGYGMRQFHWTVIGPPRNERLQRSGREVCQIETFEVTLPYVENPDPDRDFKKEQQALKQFVLETTKFIVEMERQAIENILMNLSLSESR